MFLVSNRCSSFCQKVEQHLSLLRFLVQSVFALFLFCSLHKEAKKKFWTECDGLIGDVEKRIERHV